MHAGYDKALPATLTRRLMKRPRCNMAALVWSVSTGCVTISRSGVYIYNSGDSIAAATTTKYRAHERGRHRDSVVLRICEGFHSRTEELVHVNRWQIQLSTSMFDPLLTNWKKTNGLIYIPSIFSIVQSCSWNFLGNSATYTVPMQCMPLLCTIADYSMKELN